MPIKQGAIQQLGHYSSCTECGYTCKNFKDTKFQNMILFQHMINKHKIIEPRFLNNKEPRHKIIIDTLQPLEVEEAKILRKEVLRK
jgi:hypothetical protein